jgi:hypothetical protein
MYLHVERASCEGTVKYGIIEGFVANAHVLPAKSHKNKDPTSGLEALTCSLGVSGLRLLSVAGVGKCRVEKGFSVPCLAHCCRALRAG